ncbi:sec-independent translocation protein MttA [Olsenella sp. TM06-36]|uniref:Sec-independent protein translocase subunit TatA/TatB n=1 Tax=unclassified Olsenella TaxID=2638792 RepID=UPI000E44D3C7|nr:MULTISPECIES: twin-arginine translocase TatA/TatE family subunit [unclassified Olsenella]RGJ46849.1 sec-independent translocation protein MttA [Olsenella sp. TM06-36]RHJ91479.1 sec-independent translocation protein MttA [Olsenella sp. AM05-7]RHJ97772.1 sec-independent translocation protein MttA [Olsenella sp. AM05-17]
MFGIGESELALILLFAFLIFGPDKLPGMGRTIGRALRQFRNAQEGFTQVVQTEIVDPATEAMSDAPKKPNRKRSEEEDADIEGSGSPKSTPKTETFAERKKRLEAERAAAEKAKADAAAAEKASDEDASGANADAAPAAEAPAEAKTASAPAPEASKPADEKPKPTTAADLYAMSPKRRREQQADKAEKADAPAATDTVTATDGEEGGEQQA